MMHVNSGGVRQSTVDDDVAADGWDAMDIGASSLEVVFGGCIPYESIAFFVAWWEGG